MRIRRLGENRAGEMRLTRFLRNPSVTSEEMAKTAGSRIAQRCAGRHILAIQDTTVIRSEGGGGLYLHPVIGVDADDGSLIGLIHSQFLSRTEGNRTSRRSKPVQEKESYRWLEGATKAGQVCASARKITVVADRESDIFEAFALRPENVDLVIRSAHNRSLEEGELLCEKLDNLPISGEVEIEVPTKPGRKARQAIMTVRMMETCLSCPAQGIRKGLPKTVGIAVVDVRETHLPIDGNKAIHWRLLTTHKISNLTDALAIIDIYRRRWVIEQLFRTLKTHGFDVENVQIAEETPVRNLVMAALIAAVTVQQLVHAREGGLEPSSLRPITDAFEQEDQPLLEAFCAKLEGKTQKQKNPHSKGSLAYASWVCARLGGWTGYYGKPGPIVMLNGWLYFQAAKQGASLMAGIQLV